MAMDILIMAARCEHYRPQVEDCAVVYAMYKVVHVQVHGNRTKLPDTMGE